MQPGPPIVQLLGLFVAVLLWGGAIAGWIVFLMAAWRGMKAHESVAESLRKIADKQP
jgi:hypothetical protein